ncbi:SMP-30/gluconolactonase/LRE family protein [Mesorhizobium sp. M00.F.Ca.ET.216.01.1.1]|uniref:SMP-30/gluconolactonase/LRE family protein n=1 Tax=Mesorhizobium sp. M00.F.Ca.ET.216.01.1.1 TaxID=2500528 RepID=UPI000FDAC943|nr:SMP-30/gluconolactonase/LRE family protein [Mesorhizobium sp. M00.F.Ca.ET.216.01.1.1]TGQ39469.1 SMP-30/gluconolactonase/LRE family protein [Mesorhizobium sp. M00.F.Ca.ET.216.01.1.1]
MTDRAVRQLLPGTDIVGESIVWDVERHCLFWVDIVGRAIRRCDPTGGTQQRWAVDEFPTSIGLRADGGAIVGLTRRVALWDFKGAFETLAVPEPDFVANRLNEGRVAPDGSFWVGTMQSNLTETGAPKDIDTKAGRYYRVDASGNTTLLSDDLYGITNGMVWLPGGSFVTADTVDDAIYIYDVSPDMRSISNRRSFCHAFPRGLPDGACMDAEGAVWTCRVVGGACITRTLPDGTLDRVIELPCSWPTSCTFGGPGLATLFITSARFTMTSDHLAANPQEGGLFAIRPGIAGVPEIRFG